jgi:hypothetical protein
VQISSIPLAAAAQQQSGTPSAVSLPAEAGGTQVVQVPRSAQELQALRARREELSTQLISANGRREGLARELRSAMNGADRTGIERRMTQLDQRIMRLEADIAENGRALAATPADLIATVDVPHRILGMTEQFAAPLAGLFTVVVLMPLAIAAARLMWRRARSPQPSRESPELISRLDRMEQAVDAIAVEVERISEGQRFTTRLLTEGQAMPALGSSRVAERVPVRSLDQLRLAGEET